MQQPQALGWCNIHTLSAKWASVILFFRWWNQSFKSSRTFSKSQYKHLITRLQVSSMKSCTFLFFPTNLSLFSSWRIVLSTWSFLPILDLGFFLSPIALHSVNPFLSCIAQLLLLLPPSPASASVSPASLAHSCLIFPFHFPVILSKGSVSLATSSAPSCPRWSDWSLTPGTEPQSLPWLCMSPLFALGWAPHPPPTPLFLSACDSALNSKGNGDDLTFRTGQETKGPGSWLKQGSQGNSFGLEFCSTEWQHTIAIFLEQWLPNGNTLFHQRLRSEVTGFISKCHSPLHCNQDSEKEKHMTTC